MASPTKQQAGHAVPPGVRMLPTSCSVHHAGFPSKLPAFWEQETTLYHQENMRGCGGGTQAVTELAGRVRLTWMESHLCHLPSVHGHGSPGGQPGTGPSLQTTVPWVCHTLSMALRRLHDTQLWSEGREQWPRGERHLLILASRRGTTPQATLGLSSAPTQSGDHSLSSSGVKLTAWGRDQRPLGVSGGE